MTGQNFFIFHFSHGFPVSSTDSVARRLARKQLFIQFLHIPQTKCINLLYPHFFLILTLDILSKAKREKKGFQEWARI